MKIEGLKILVTGGAGFIGSHIVESLVKKGAFVRVIDNLSTGKLENLSEVKKDIEFILGDIRNDDLLHKVTKDIDVVSHHAAQLEIGLSTSNPVIDLELNTTATIKLLQASIKNNVSKFIFASSACVYGQKTSITTEDEILHPNWAYGISKMAAEEYVRLFSELYDISCVSLRYSIIFGEREWFRRALPIFIKRVIERKPPVVFDDGSSIRDFLYVKDLVNLHNLVIEKDNLKSEVFNVSSGIPRTIKDIATFISQRYFDGTVVFENLKEGEKSKYIDGKIRNQNDLKVMWLSPEKAKRELGWEPKTPFEEAIDFMYEWAKNNLHRWEKIQRSSE